MHIAHTVPGTNRPLRIGLFGTGLLLLLPALAAAGHNGGGPVASVPAMSGFGSNSPGWALQTQKLMNQLGYQWQNGQYVPKPFTGTPGFRYDPSGAFQATIFANGVLVKGNDL